MNNINTTMMRGIIAEHFIAVEGLVSAIISQHYLRKPDTDFIINVLGNEQAGFGFKRNILEHILLKDGDFDQQRFNDLNTLNKIRNLFAHSILEIHDQEGIQDRYFTDPRNRKNKIHIKGECDRFMEIYPIVISWLQTIAKRKGMTFTVDPNPPFQS